MVRQETRTSLGHFPRPLTSPPPPVTLGLHVDSCMAKDMSITAGMPVAFSARSKSDLNLRQGEKMLAEAALSAEMVLISSMCTVGGVHLLFGFDLLNPQLRKEMWPLGNSASALGSLQLPLKWRPWRPLPIECLMSSPLELPLDFVLPEDWSLLLSEALSDEEWLSTGAGFRETLSAHRPSVPNSLLWLEDAVLFALLLHFLPDDPRL